MCRDIGGMVLDRHCLSARPRRRRSPWVATTALCLAMAGSRTISSSDKAWPTCSCARSMATSKRPSRSRPSALSRVSPELDYLAVVVSQSSADCRSLRQGTDQGRAVFGSHCGYFGKFLERYPSKVFNRRHLAPGRPTLRCNAMNGGVKQFRCDVLWLDRSTIRI